MTASRRWHELSPAEAAAQLGVDPARGLTASEVRERLLRHGPNVLPETPPPSLLTLLGRQIKNFIVVLLFATVVLSAVLGELGDALAILAALLLNVLVGLFMDYRAERSIASLQSLTAPQARVRREGQEREVPAGEVVPGDVVLLGAGDRVPADARILSGECKVDESLLTGESLPVAKHPAALPAADLPLSERANEVFAGSLVRMGSSVVGVSATGSQTEIGRIGSLLDATKPPQVPLNLRLASLGRYIVWTVAAVSALLVALGLWQGSAFWPLLRTAVVLAIAAIPEGLPSVATLALAAGARRLARRKLRIRHLGVLEALGGTTSLCLDKTGTLTENAMTVRAVRIEGHDLTVTGEGWSPTGEFLEAGQRIEPRAHPVLVELLQACQRCNEATLEQDSKDGWHIHGDPSEGALLCAAAKAGLSDPRVEERSLRTLPAAQGHPWMVVVSSGKDGERVSVKGAPEQVLARCLTVRTEEGSRPLDEGTRARWSQANHELAGRALRVFGVAVAPSPGPGAELEQGWEWLGLIGMADPPRQGVKEALREAHDAGIRTIMITGDQAATAVAIARELDLADGREPRVLVNARTLDRDIDVYARATPEGKFALVRALRAEGEMVAMTGDGVNDAPALRTADAGIAMGHGTEVAKAAAGIILVEESLPTLLSGIKEGRSVFLNIQKAIDYLLSCSIATVLAALITTAVGNPPILLPLQILYLNLLMHTFPALGLTLEPADPDVMKRPPLERAAALVTPVRMAAIIWHGVIISIAAVAIGAWGLHHGGEAHARSLAFATLASSLLLHAFSDRSARPFRGFAARRNPTLLVFIGVALGLQFLALYLPGLSRLLSMTEFNPHDWLGIVGAAAGTVLAVELSKWAMVEPAPVRRPRRAAAPGQGSVQDSIQD